MSILNNSLLLGAAAGASTYQISRSLRFNSADSAYLSRTPASAGNRTTWTWAGWVKRNKIGTAQILFVAFVDGSNYSTIEFYGAGDQLRIANTIAGVDNSAKLTTQAFRDTSAWYHVIVSSNSSTSLKVYVNGSEVTSFAVTTGPGSSNWFYNSTIAHDIGRYSSGFYADYMLADVHFIDGQALTPSSFGAFDANNVWQPKAYSGSYGTNGFHLDFADNSAATAAALGKDTSGNGNNWTPNNLSISAGSGNDSLVDSPTNYGTDTGAGGEVRGNYCTWNPLDKAATASLVNPSNGNLRLDTGLATNAYGVIRNTIGMYSGKWYFELALNTKGSGDVEVGICKASATLSGYLGKDANAWAYGTQGNKYNNNSGSAYGASWTSGDVIGVAFDADTGTLAFYKNGTAQGTAFTGLTSGPYFFAVDVHSFTPGSSHDANFGQRPFAYTAPSGYKALCSTNLPTPTILNGATAMDVKLWTGNGTSQTISGLGFSPDLVWVKVRSSNSYHALYDQIRGVNQRLSTNDTGAENTTASSVTSFDSTGFSLGSYIGVNENSQTFAAWCWDAGSSTVTNTAGTIQSTVRANASAGFSIVTYQGNSTLAATVGHGLGVVPHFIVTKSRSVGGTNYNWGVYHVSLGNSSYLKLNTTEATNASSSQWNNTSPTSTVFSVGNQNESNNSASTYVAYCFAPVSGYSAFGSITANGTTDGPFAYLGFRPRFLLFKNASSATGNWAIFDSARSTGNVIGPMLQPNSSVAEFTSDEFDFLSNGIKLRYNYTNGNQIIYAAFAENPFSISRAR